MLAVPSHQTAWQRGSSMQPRGHVKARAQPGCSRREAGGATRLEVELDALANVLPQRHKSGAGSARSDGASRGAGQTSTSSASRTRAVQGQQHSADSTSSKGAQVGLLI